MDKQKLWDAAVAHNGLDVMGWDKAPMITIENPDELESLMAAIQSAAAPQVVADERAAFEKFCCDREQPLDHCLERSKEYPDDYDLEFIDWCWEGWKARAALVAAPVQTQEPVDWQKIALYYNDLYSKEKNRAPVQPVAVPEALRLLSILFDSWENGTACQESFDGVSIGNAFKLSDEDFHACVKILEGMPRAAPAAQGDAKELTDDEIEAMMHESGLIGIAGDNPLLESKLIAFARAAIAAKAAS